MRSYSVSKFFGNFFKLQSYRNLRIIVNIYSISLIIPTNGLQIEKEILSNITLNASNVTKFLFGIRCLLSCDKFHFLAQIRLSIKEKLTLEDRIVYLTYF